MCSGMVSPALPRIMVCWHLYCVHAYVVASIAGEELNNKICAYTHDTHHQANLYSLTLYTKTGS